MAAWLKILTEHLTGNGGAMPGTSDPLIRKQDGSGEALSYYVINRVATRWTKRHLDARLTPPTLRHACGAHLIRRKALRDIRYITRAETSRNS